MSGKIKIKDKLDDETLDLSFSELTEVPIREIAVIKKAYNLDLSNNQLVSLPNEIVLLTRIVKLDLSKNFLTEIPENIGELRQLRHLDLYSNQITRLPLSVGDLKNLKWLDLKDNPLSPAIASVAGTCLNSTECQACARKIVAFFANLKQDIDVEKQRRINAVAATATDAAVKKEPKKKKKKADKEKHVENISSTLISNQSTVVDGTPQVNDISKQSNCMKSSGGFCGLLYTLVSSIVVLLFVVGLLLYLTFVVLPKYDRERSNSIVDYLQDRTQLPIEHYQELAIQTESLITKNMVNLFNRSMVFVEEFYERTVKPN